MRAPASWLLALALASGGCKSPSPTDRRPGEDGGTGAIARDVRALAEGCHDNSGCPPDHYCEFTPGLCGKGKRPGTCRPKPPACEGPSLPACGCDGKTYPSACVARVAGVDLAVMGGCKERIPNFAPCGRSYCDVRTSYCEIFLSDVFELPTDYFCRPLPPSCLPVDGAPRGCDCFPAGTRCSAFCGPLPSAPGGASGFHLTCQGTRPPND